jgi:hypothetical protein
MYIAAGYRDHEGDVKMFGLVQGSRAAVQGMKSMKQCRGKLRQPFPQILWSQGIHRKNLGGYPASRQRVCNPPNRRDIAPNRAERVWCNQGNAHAAIIEGKWSYWQVR